MVHCIHAHCRLVCIGLGEAKRTAGVRPVSQCHVPVKGQWLYLCLRGARRRLCHTYCTQHAARVAMGIWLCIWGEYHVALFLTLFVLFDHGHHGPSSPHARTRKVTACTATDALLHIITHSFISLRNIRNIIRLLYGQKHL